MLTLLLPRLKFTPYAKCYLLHLVETKCKSRLANIHIYSYANLVMCTLDQMVWSGGAMVLGKSSSAGASYNLDDSRAKAYCACNRCGWGLFGHFFSLSFLFSFSRSLGEARYRLKYCLKEPLNPKQPTNLPTRSNLHM